MKLRTLWHDLRCPERKVETWMAWRGGAHDPALETLFMAKTACQLCGFVFQEWSDRVDRGIRAR